MKGFKKVFGFVLAIVLVLSLGVTALADDTPALLIKTDKSDIVTGENVKVTLAVDAAVENIFAFQMDLYYDAQLLSFVSAETEGYDYSDNTDANGDKYIRIMQLDLTGEHTLEGEFITFTFTGNADGECSFDLSGVKFTGVSAAIRVAEPEAVTVKIAHEHQWDDGEVTAEPDGDKAGERTYHCTVDGCEETKTEEIPALAIKVQPMSVSAAPGGIATVTVIAEGEGLTYNWYYKNAGASKFSYTSSFKGSSYSITMDETRNGRQVYCVVADKYGNEVTTNTATLTMGETVKITAQPESVIAGEGETVKVTVKATGDGLTYRWYYKNAGASKFSYTSSFKSNVYTATMSEARNGRQVYCVISDKYGNEVKTDMVTLTMRNNVKITAQPESVTVAEGKTAKVTVKATGDGLTYRWYFKNAGASKFSYTSSFKSNTYSVTMSDSRSGRQVYCVISDKYGNEVRTNTVTLSQEEYAKITTQPKSVTVAEGKKATVTVEATGDGLTYKWYYKDKGSSKFTYTSTFTGNSYSITMSDARNGRQVYCVITDAYGNSVTTNTVTLKQK